MVFSVSVPYMDQLMALPGGQFTAFLVVFAVLALAFEVILVMLLKLLGFFVGKTKTTLDDRLLNAVRAFLPTLSIVTSLWIALEAVYPGLVVFANFSELDAYVLVMLGVVGLMLSSIADNLLIWYGLEIRPRAKKLRDEEVFPLVRNVIKIAIVTIFVVIIMQRLGFDTAAIVTGLGVGGLAVALALQDTLGNFFGGVHILVDKPFKEEDFIKLENGIEGTVKQIGWRTTRILTPAHNEVIVPNSKLAGAIVENYSAPDDISEVTYNIGVDCKEDVDNVQKVMIETLQKAAKKNAIMDAPSIWVRFESFGEYTLNFKFGYNIHGYVNRSSALKDVNRALFYAFRENGIKIPFPVRVVYPAAKEMEGKKK